ncbi:efflux RND transporter periplasmic adaptor subunit [Leptolyngbya sp. FACHB-36]|uniref:efflux RND transporter periplasmic adaptor subunit n=1 Tax=Leptolyngbya sp. FACHB-36 TaxID=2692808 RepID=UPI0016802791|nr:efflux RND transporter periplasmic adaptor subunit [Leptolyngbya sp. FACHB-36]MBD2022571.1 efflux RND transporter periplasmic adaptor subunit [Leptolyngbya sp. FACHB-36]
MQLPFVGTVTKRSTPWIVGLAATGLVGVSAATFLVTRNAPSTAPVNDLTVPVQLKDITVQIAANGTVVPVQTVNLSPKTSGRLVQLRVEQGDRVTQGQAIARMESTELEAQRNEAVASLMQAQANLSLLRSGSRPEAIGQAQAGVEQAQAEVTTAQTRLNLASQRVSRNQGLASEGAITRDRLDEVLNEERSARANLEQAQARLNNARQGLTQQENGPRVQEIEQGAAQVAAAQARLQAINKQLEDTIIRAPFSGIITQKYATVGAFVTPTTSASSTSSATSTSIVALANGLEVLAKVPEVDIGQIKLGQEVEIRADAYPNQVFKGKVRLIAPEAVVEQSVTSFQVRVQIISGINQLRSGMNTDLTFLGRRLDQALLVPTAAIVTNKGQTGVLIPDTKNKPTFRPVTIGPTVGSQTQVLDGVREGDFVYDELPEGQKLDDVIKDMNQQK